MSGKLTFIKSTEKESVIGLNKFYKIASWTSLFVNLAAFLLLVIANLAVAL